MDKLRDLRVALDALAVEIGLPSEALVAAERLDAVRFYDADFPTKQLAALSEERVASLRAICGDALALAVKIDAVPLFTLGKNTTAESYEQLRQDLRGQQTVKLELTIDKSTLPTHWHVAVACPIVRLFLHGSRCGDIIAGTIHEPSQLESLLWNETDEGKCVVVLADTGILIDGPYLAVVGVEQYPDWAAKQSDRMLAVGDVHRIHAACREMVRWEQPWTRHLIPQALSIATDEPASHIVQGIFAHWVNVSILFLADRVREQEDMHIAIFVTERRRAQATMLEQGDLAESLEPAHVEAVGKIASWAYEEQWSGDRLRMAQALIAQTLSGLHQPVPARQLLANAPAIWHDLQWQWKSFMAKEIERYTTEERELENEVGETVAGFDTEVADMIKSLTAAMLGAVGALIGSLIAGAFKDPFNPLIFSTGVYAFLAYLVVFPGVYGMMHHLIRFHTLKRIFIRRRERFERIIDRQRVADIVGNTIGRGTCRFYCWFSATLLALTVVAILCLVAIAKVPKLVQRASPGAPVPAGGTAPPAQATPPSP